MGDERAQYKKNIHKEHREKHTQPKIFNFFLPLAFAS